MDDIVERLNQGWMATLHPDRTIVTVNTMEWMRCTDLTREAAMEIQRLRDERDRARQMYCRLASEADITGFKQDAEKIAHALMWDCFKTSGLTTPARRGTLTQPQSGTAQPDAAQGD